MLKPYCALAGALSLVALPSAVLAQTTVNSSRAGWANQAGTVSSRNENSNSFTGVNGSGEHRSYISFAVPASTSAFTSAVIRVNAESVYSGPNDLTVYDVSSDIATATVTDLYADFGSGAVFGTITGLISGATGDITLNADGLAAVNAARGGEISFGFVSSPTTTSPDGVFGASTGSTQRQLILSPTANTAPPSTIPTMSEWAMILFGLSLAGG
ncbi:hypothetical protein GVN18_44255, partial [Pseudomonas sp. ODNR1LW]|nr:hypothetical protein [Pseudomonas sp. ODNR1LW]